MGGCVQCDASVWSQKRKNECIYHREKDLKLDFESQMDEDAKLEWNLVALFCESTPCGTSNRALTQFASCPIPSLIKLYYKN